jgi:demethylspheroidene O-methyltransferase
MSDLSDRSGDSLTKPPACWRERLLAWRNRLVADPKFQRWAASFPLTRPIARRRARQLFDLCAGFVYSQILDAFIRLNVAEILFEGPATTSELARRLSLSPDRTLTLLRATSALGLTMTLRPVNGEDRFALGELGAALLGNPGVAAMVEHHAMLYADLRDPVALLRGEARETALGGYWPYAARGALDHLSAEQIAAYSGLMSASQPLIADDVLDAFPIGRHRVLMDVGGGEGRFLASAAQRDRKLKLMLFDLPPVAERARTHFESLGLAHRAEVHGGDFQVDSLPKGADLISLVRVIHDHDDDIVRVLLKAIHAALPANGTLIVAEPMSGVAGAEPIGDAYFGFYLMAMGRGRPRTAAEITELLIQAGFRKAQETATRRPMLTGLVVAEV